MNFGFLPLQFWHLVFPIAALVLYEWGRKRARARHVTRYYTSAILVSFWEEILFRGLIFGVILSLLPNIWWALVLSSLLFGLFHLRNYWWANRKRLISMCLYTGIIVGPILAYSRILTGDIYLGIFLHFLHNYLVVFPPPFAKKWGNEIPTDEFLSAPRTKKM